MLPEDTIKGNKLYILFVLWLLFSSTPKKVEEQTPRPYIGNGIGPQAERSGSMGGLKFLHGLET